jgi:hypothetical protein
VTTGLRTWFDKAGPLAQSLTILAAVIAVLAVGLLLWRGSRAALRGKKAADTLTVVAAAMASSVAATGMWHFFSRTMHLPTWIQAVLFAFMEISVLASALRARANVARDGNAGADGLAVWVLTCASGLMSASEASSIQEALVRLGAPLVAAWLWERSMVPERRAQKVKQGTAESAVRWLFSVKRIAIRLGLATALGADLETEDANRRIDRFVRADNKSQRAGWLTRRHAGRRRDRAHARLMEQARMQADPRALYSHLGRQAILDVLARLGGDDAVIDRERARQMQHILADATGDGAGAGDGAPAAAPAPAARTAGRTGSHAARRAPAAAPSAPNADPQPEPARPTTTTTAPIPEPQPEFAPRQDELPLHLPPQPVHVLDAANGAAAYHIPAARQPAPTNGNSANGHAITFVAPPLPEPEPEPEPTYSTYAYEPEPEYEPEPPAPVQQPAPAPPPIRVQDEQLVNRINRAMTASASARIQPNLIKLARELGISPALMNDTIEAMGGFNAMWTRAQQDQAAENAGPDLEYYPA